MNLAEELSVATLQPMLTLHDLEENLRQYESLFQKEKKLMKQTDVICFPEYWNGLRIGSSSKSNLLDSKEFLKDVAIEYSTWVVGGSQIVQEGNKNYNRSFIFNQNGTIIGEYDKQRLFGYEQTQNITPGKSLFAWRMGNFKAGIRICNDLWKVKLVQELISEEIDILFVPALTVVPEESYTNYGQHIWHNLAFIRAKEGAMAVIVSDIARSVLSDPYWSTGASCIADPSQKFTNLEPRGQNMLLKLDSGRSGILWKTFSLQQLTDQKNYRKIIGLL